MDPAQLLPLEVVHKIFILLSPCKEFQIAAKVSKRWQVILKEVFRLRVKYLLSALYMGSDLRWFPAVTAFTTSDSISMLNRLPTERFGSSLIRKDELLYVFGGATSELTAFNDLWVFELQSATWTRLTTKGERPSPRAFTKSGLLDNKIYVYGGCQTARHSIVEWVCADWLNDIYSFCMDTNVWSFVRLRRFNGQQPNESPRTLVGDSGTFLPASGDFPASLILFGGYSRQDGLCVNTTQVILPASGQWFPLPLSENSPRPPGRYGHATCALGDSRIVVIGGNLNPPRRPNSDSSSVNSTTEGNPARDIWLLSRCQRKTGDQELYQVPWFWSKVDCSADGPCCPPADFYHAVAVGIPELVDTCQDRQYGRPWSAFVILISAATQRIRNLTASMRRRRRLLGHQTSPTLSFKYSSFPFSSSPRLNGAVIVAEQLEEHEQPTKGIIIRQRSSTLEVPKTPESSLVAIPPPLPSKPLVSYHLRIVEQNSCETNEVEKTTQLVLEGEWKGFPSRSELQSAPSERLGYSCVEGFGSIFLFGGIQPSKTSVKAEYRHGGGTASTSGSEGDEGSDDTSGDEMENGDLNRFDSPIKRRLMDRRQSVLVYSLHSADFVGNLT